MEKHIGKSIHRHEGKLEKRKLVKSLTYKLPKSISPKEKRVDKYRFNAVHNALANAKYNKMSPKQKQSHDREEMNLRRHPDDK